MVRVSKAVGSVGLVASVALLGSWSPLVTGQECEEDWRTPVISTEYMGNRFGLERLITLEAFQMMFKGAFSLASCDDGLNRLQYEGLILAAKDFPEFCNSGDSVKDRMELAAFLAHVAHETTGGWATAPCGQATYGVCFGREMGCPIEDDPDENAPCRYYTGETCEHGQYDNVPHCKPAVGKKYYGRGGLQLSYNYNYAAFSASYYNDFSVLLNNPDLVALNPRTAWASAIWFWMTPQYPKQSCHEALFGSTSPDNVKGAKGGFGFTTLIINGGVECNINCASPHPGELDRISTYRRLSFILGVPMCASPDHTVSCAGLGPYPISQDNRCGEVDENCQLSNEETCYQLDGSTLYPPGSGLKAGGCTGPVSPSASMIPATRTKKDCTEVPDVTNTAISGKPSYYCQEKYEVTAADDDPVDPVTPGNDKTDAPTPDTPTQTPDNPDKTDSPNPDDNKTEKPTPDDNKTDPKPEDTTEAVKAATARIAQFGFIIGSLGAAVIASAMMS